MYIKKTKEPVQTLDRVVSAPTALTSQLSSHLCRHSDSAVVVFSVPTCVVAHLKMAGLVKQLKTPSRSRKQSDSALTNGEFMSRQ